MDKNGLNSEDGIEMLGGVFDPLPISGTSKMKQCLKDVISRVDFFSDIRTRIVIPIEFTTML